MYPILFELGPIKVHSYGVAILVAFLSALVFARKRAPRFGLHADQITDAAFWALILGVLGARLGFIVQEMGYFSQHPRELLSLQFQGLTSFGGVIGGAIGLWFYSRRAKIDTVRVYDAVSAPMMLAIAIGRIGCLLNGCCYGVACDLPWGIHVDQHIGTFHPAQIYDSLMNLAAMGILLWIERRSYRRMSSLAWFFILSMGARFIYEFFRAGSQDHVDRGLATSTYWGSLPITQAQAVALAFVLLGCGLLVISKRAKADTGE